MALLIAVCFPSVLLGLEAFVYGDMGQFAYPVAHFQREAFWRGQWPLWNPLNSCGIPFLAQWNTLCCYPLSLFYLLLPMPWSFGVFCLGHMLFAAVGMFMLGRRWTNNSFAAAVAGTAYGFNGLIWQSVMWPHFLAALAWMPWFILATEKAWKEGGRSILLAALAGAMQMLSGGAEVIIQTWLVLGALWLIHLFRSEEPRGRLMGRMAAIGILIVAISAVQLGPFLDLLAHSQRSSGYGSGGMSEIGVMSLAGLADFLVPLFHCVQNAQGVFVQVGQQWVSSYYIGVGILLFAAFAVWRVRGWRVWFLAGLVFFSVLMALGEPGKAYSVIKKVIPILGFVRFPVKFVAIACFALPLLAALGINGLFSASTHSRAKEWFKIKIVALLLVGLIAAIVLLAWVHPTEGEPFAVIGENAAVRIGVLIAVIGLVGLVLGATDFKAQVLLQCVIIALLWLDVRTQGSNPTPAAPAVALKPGIVRSFFNWDDQLSPGTSRALESRDSFWKMFSTGSSDLVSDTYARRRAMSMNLNLLDDVAKFDGFYSMDLENYIQVFERVFFTTNSAAGLKDFVGISHVSNPTNILDWVTRESFLPLVVAGQKPVFASDADALRGIFSADFEPRRIAYFPPEAKGQIHATNQSNAKAVLERFSPERLDIRTESDAPAIVTIAQTFYHPWHAYVDGRRTPLWRANYAFQAVEVPAGKHELKAVYEDTAFLWGAIVSFLSAFGCVGMWLYCGRKAPEPRDVKLSK